MTRRALTLIEVLVATVLCGAGLAIACMALAGLVRTEGGADERVRAARCLERVLARIEGEELPLEDQSGDCAAEGEPWLRWEVFVTPGAVEGLREVVVVAVWQTPTGEQSHSLTRSIFVDPLGQGLLR